MNGPDLVEALLNLLFFPFSLIFLSASVHLLSIRLLLSFLRYLTFLHFHTSATAGTSTF